MKQKIMTAQVNDKNSKLSLAHTFSSFSLSLSLSLWFNRPRRQIDLKHDQTEAPFVLPPKPGVRLHSDQREEL